MTPHRLLLSCAVLLATCAAAAAAGRRSLHVNYIDEQDGCAWQLFVEFLGPLATLTKRDLHVPPRFNHVNATRTMEHWSRCSGLRAFSDDQGCGKGTASALALQIKRVPGSPSAPALRLASGPKEAGHAVVELLNGQRGSVAALLHLVPELKTAECVTITHAMRGIHHSPATRPPDDCTHLSYEWSAWHFSAQWKNGVIKWLRGKGLAPSGVHGTRHLSRYGSLHVRTEKWSSAARESSACWESIGKAVLVALEHAQARALFLAADATPQKASKTFRDNKSRLTTAHHMHDHLVVRGVYCLLLLLLQYFHYYDYSSA